MRVAACCLRLWLLAACFAGLALSAFAARADVKDGQPWWPSFHGPLRDNVSRETGLMKKWPEGGPRLVWKRSGIGLGYSGVSLAEGRIFTAGDFDDVEKVIALDLDGRLLWERVNGESWTGAYPGSRTTPSWSGGMLYQMNPKGRLAAFKAESGGEVWNADLKERFGARYGTWAMSENVAVEGGPVYCIPGGGDALMVALDRLTGKTVWVNDALDETAAYCSPIIVTHNGRRQLIAMTQKSIVGVDAADGKLLWSHPHLTRGDQNVNAPLYHEGYVFTASGHSGGGRVVKINESSSAVEELWWDKDLDNCHGSVMQAGGYLFGSSCRAGGRGFFCAELLTGRLAFREKRMEKLSLTAAEGLIYGLGQEGAMHLVRPTPEKLEIISSFAIPQDTKELAWAHPVIAGGRLYLRRGEYLYAYDLRAE